MGRTLTGVVDWPILIKANLPGFASSDNTEQ
jgi:hypothetical protein